MTLYKLKYDTPYSHNIVGKGHTVIVTGWTRPNLVAEALHKTYGIEKAESMYAVIGPLYDARVGISYLVRNILYNPQVQNLILLGVTKYDRQSKSIDYLEELIKNVESLTPKKIGGAKKWALGALEAYIDIEIPNTVLEGLFMYRLFTKRVDSLEECVKLLGAIDKHHTPEMTYDRVEFSVPEKMESVIPYGHQSGLTIRGKTVADAYPNVLHSILTSGQESEDKRFGAELINLTVVVTDEPREPYIPTTNYLPVDEDYMRGYSLLDSTVPDGVEYTYGSRIHSWFGCNQLENILSTLRKNINSTQGVINLYDTTKDPKGLNPPCLNHIWVRVLEGKLILCAVFRSNDMYSAWPANALALRELQYYIADHLDLCVGELITTSQSAHIYQGVMDNARDVVQEWYTFRKEYDDPVGNFLIYLDKKIIVEHQVKGVTRHRWEGIRAAPLLAKISQHCPTLDTSHALYLGYELARAEGAKVRGEGYTQDS